MKKIKVIFSKTITRLILTSILMIIFSGLIFNRIEAKRPFKITSTMLTTASPISQNSNPIAQSNPNLNHSLTTALDSTKNLEFVPKDIRRILEKGKLVVAIRNAETPPFIMIKDNCKNLEKHQVCVKVNGKEKAFYGLDIEIAEGIIDALNGGLKKVLGKDNLIKLELDASQYLFDEIVKQVVIKKADIAVSKLSISPERSVLVNFSQPYLNMDFGLLVNRKRAETAYQASKLEKEDFLKQLPGEKIGVLEASFSGRLAEKLFSKSHIKSFYGRTRDDAWKEVINAVKADENTEPLAAFRDELEIKLQVFRHPDDTLYLETVLFTDIKDLISVVVSPEKTQLLTVINHYLTRARHNYTVDDLICQYPQAFKLQKTAQYLEKHCQ